MNLYKWTRLRETASGITSLSIHVVVFMLNSFGCVCFHFVVFISIWLYLFEVVVFCFKSLAEGMEETAFDILPALHMFCCILVVFTCFCCILLYFNLNIWSGLQRLPPASAVSQYRRILWFSNLSLLEFASWETMQLAILEGWKYDHVVDRHS